MKAKKASKRLGIIETLLSDVLKRYSTRPSPIREQLETAKAAVKQAKSLIESSGSKKVAGESSMSNTEATQTNPGKSSAAKADSTAKSNRLSEEGRKRISLAAKKRWASAKRKGVHAVTGQKLSKTA